MRAPHPGDVSLQDLRRVMAAVAFLVLCAIAVELLVALLLALA